MIWGGISFEAHTDLVLVENGSLNAHRYIREILELLVVPYGHMDIYQRRLCVYAR
jgi:hypothetical protein